MKNCTERTRRAGELAIRLMSVKAQAYYYGFDCLKIYEYEEDATDEAGEVIDVNTLYGWQISAEYKEGLIFEEMESILEAWQDESEGLEEEDEEEE